MQYQMPEEYREEADGTFEKCGNEGIITVSGSNAGRDFWLGVLR